LMNGFILGVWHIALVFEAPDNPCRGPDLFCRRAIIFRWACSWLLLYTGDQVASSRRKHRHRMNSCKPLINLPHRAVA
jgi:hypothetical protein